MRRIGIVLLMLLLAACSDTSRYHLPSGISIPFLKDKPQQQAATPPAKINPADKNVIEKITSVNPMDVIAPQPPVHVALLLPLSGEQAELGKAMMDAAHMALVDTNATTIDLRPFDTKDTEFFAKQAIEKALQVDSRLIIGPVFSKSTQAVAPVSLNNRVPLLSLSNDASLLGKGVYLLGFMPDQQIRRIAEYAARQELKDVAVIVPNNVYGTMAADVFSSTLKNFGGTIHKTEFYAIEDTQLKANLNRIVDGVLATPAKAIFIPEGGERLLYIASRIKEKNPAIQLIGSGQWDDASLLRQSALEGGIFAGSEPQRRISFERRFEQAYNYQPPRIASLAYDAVALAVTASRERERMFAPEVLANPRGFMGVDGIFRLRANGMIERGLAILQITPNGFKTIEAAPAQFAEQ